MPYNKFITCSKDLVTSKEETRAGFINFALEKNKRSTPFIESAKVFKHYAQQATEPKDLLKIPEIRESLLTASGLSDKALNYFSEKDKDQAISELIKNFLEPAGADFVNEVVYRYLLIRGDSLGGSMRNIAGSLSQEKLIRSLLASTSVLHITYYWTDGRKSHGETIWNDMPTDDYGLESKIKAIGWSKNDNNRVLGFNMVIPTVGKNIDINLFNCLYTSFDSILSDPKKSVMHGELKGGIDPAGADEHWKTGKSALQRIRDSYAVLNIPVMTSFVGAAIETQMAIEIFSQLENGTMNNAANLTKDDQLIEYCNWILNL